MVSYQASHGGDGSAFAAAPAARTHRWLLAALILLAILLDVLFAPTISGNDDLSIGGSAIDLLERGFHIPAGHYAARFGLTIPIAGIFRTFGIGVLQLNALSWLFSLAGLFCAYRLGAILFDRTVGLLGAAVLAFYPLYVEYARLAFPDVIQGVALAGAVVLALSANRQNRSSLSYNVLAGICWAYAYYVKVDAFFLGFVFLVLTLLGYIRWRSLFIIGAVTGALVGLELLFYGIELGKPFYRIQLERIAANEVLGAGMDYRNWITYPKAMFLTVYETGLAFYLLVAAMIAAFAARSRPAIFLFLWVAIFLVWLTLGVDPFGATFRLKPQLPRYLLVFAIPMCVLIGWSLKYFFHRLSKWVAYAAAAAMILAAVPLMAFDQLNYEPTLATLRALDITVAQNYFPLYPDNGSSPLAKFVLHDSPRRADVHYIHNHDFLAGKTTFGSVDQSPAYMLINYDFQQRLLERSLVQPLDPQHFGMRVREVASIDNPAWPVSYSILRLLGFAGGMLPIASVRDHIQKTAQDVLRPQDARIYRLDR
jgi:hypothetical protein